MHHNLVKQNLPDVDDDYRNYLNTCEIIQKSNYWELSFREENKYKSKQSNYTRFTKA